MLKFKYAKIEDIPQGYEGLYLEVKGEWVLQADKIEGVSLNTKVKEFRDTNVKLKSENDELKKRLESFSDIDVEEYNDLKLKKDEYEEQKLIKDKDIEAVVEERTRRMKEDHDKAVKRLESEIKKRDDVEINLKSELSNVKIDNALSFEVSKLKGLNPEMHDIAVMLGKNVFRMNDENEPVAKDDNGDVIYGKDGLSPMTIPEWVSTIPDTRPSFMLDSNGMNSNGGGKRTPDNSLKNSSGRAKLDHFFKENL